MVGPLVNEQIKDEERDTGEARGGKEVGGLKAERRVESREKDGWAPRGATELREEGGRGGERLIKDLAVDVRHTVVSKSFIIRC